MRRLGVSRGTPSRNRQEQRLGQRQIVRGPERAAAKVAELEPEDPAGGAGHGQVARSDLDVPRAGRAAVTEGVEGALQPRVGLRPQREVIDRQVAQPHQPVIDCPVQRHHIDLAEQELDERHEPIAIEAILVEAVGRPVRRRDHHHTLLEQGLEQAAQDHGIGDVDDMELVEAEQPVLPGEIDRQNGSAGPRARRSAAADAGADARPA